MSRNKRVLLGVGLLMLPAIGIIAVIIFVQRPVADHRIVSPTALPQFDPYVVTRAAQQTQTRKQLLIDITAAMDTRVQDKHAASLNPTFTPSPTPLPLAQSDYMSCGWMWATQINPELSAEIQQRLAERLVGIESVEVTAEGFGENCLNPDGSVRYFATMQTDFRLVVQVSGLPENDPTATQSILGPIVRDTLTVLANYPVDATPGPNPGMINLQFPTEDGTYLVWVNYNTAMQAFNQNLADAALFAALDGLRAQPEQAIPIESTPTPV
jgi:hypothetical protein